MMRIRAIFTQALIGLSFASIFTAAAANDVVDPVKSQGTAIRDRFITAMRECGVEPPFVPGVTVETHPGIVSYWSDDRSVHLSRWNEIPPDVQGMLSGWAASGTMGLTPEAMFSEIFNSLLVAHELGHYMQFISGRHLKLDNWESEVEANQIAIAFWSVMADDAAKLPLRVQNFNAFLEKLPDPVPAGGDPRAYFVANYEKLGSDPMAYGWYQGKFMRVAWDERSNRNFCDWARMNAPLKEPANN